MYEYICKVVLDNQEDEIKTFAYSTLEAFDNLVSMEGVTDITFDGDLMALRKARGNIKDEHLIIEELYRLDGTKKRNSFN